MRTGKKLLTGMILVLFIVFVAGCGKVKKPVPCCRRCATAARRSNGDTPPKKNGATLWRLPSCEVLTEKTASDITTQLENVQSCGETTLLEEAAFEIELDITYIHTDEIVA